MKNILILTYWSYPDALIQTYTLPYISIIRKNLPAHSSIYLLTLEKDKKVFEKENREVIESRLMQDGIHWLPFEYRSFGIAAFILWARVSLRLISIIIQKEISVIHCWCTPSGAIGYFLALLLNRKLVLDSYEPHAEAMVENGTWKREGIAFRLLFWLEKKQTQRADYIISATQGMHYYAIQKYSTNIRHFVVKPACVDFRLFNINETVDTKLLMELGLENKIVCVYAGKFGGIYLDIEVFDFIKVASDYWGDSFRFLLLTSHTMAEVEGYCKQAQVDIHQVIVRFVPHTAVASYLRLADFALTPVKPVPTKRYCTPIKNGEYWALGLPVVIPANISDDSEIIENNNIGAILYSFNREAYKNSVVKIDTLRRQPGIKNVIRSIALRYRNYSIAEDVYFRVYSSI
jgi:hypothetical protein